MAQITVTDKDYNKSNLLYVQNSLSELLTQINGSATCKQLGSRSVLSVVCDEEFSNLLRCEIADTTKRNKGEYTVTDGSTKFKAYSDNVHFERGDYVNVIIPKLC